MQAGSWRRLNGATAFRPSIAAVSNMGCMVDRKRMYPLEGTNTVAPLLGFRLFLSRLRYR